MEGLFHLAHGVVQRAVGNGIRHVLDRGVNELGKIDSSELVHPLTGEMIQPVHDELQGEGLQAVIHFPFLFLLGGRC